jgi:RHS repeat-associated protein
MQRVRRGFDRFVSLALTFVLLTGPALANASVAVAIPQTADAVADSELGYPGSQVETTGTEADLLDSAEEAAGPVSTEPPTVVREIVEKRTEVSKHYELSDGTLRAEIHDGPIHYREGSQWKDIVTSLGPTPTPGTFRSRATPAKVETGPQAPGEHPVRIERDGWAVGIDMLGTVERAPVVVGNKARYVGVAKSADLEYEVLPGGLKETVVLSSADAPATFSFALELDGLELRRVPGGPTALFEPGAASPSLYLGELTVFDSSENAAGDPEYCTESTMSVDVIGTQTILTYTLSEQWLEDPARVFPVRVDPTFYASEDTFIASAYPTTAYGSSTELKVGYYDSTTGHNRALVKFNTSSVPANAYVASAQFRAYLFHQYYASAATDVYVGRVTSAWSNATTWNTRPSHTNLGTQSVTGRGVWVSQGCAATVQNWLRGTWANHGFSIYQKEDGTQNLTHWKKFYSREAGSAYDPQLIVDYSIPTDSVSGYTSAYRLGDTATAQMLVLSPSWSQVREMRMLLNYTGGDSSRYRGYLAWFTYDPGSGWVTRKLSDTSYLAYQVGSGFGTDRIVPDLAASSVGSSGTENYRRVTWKFKIGENFGDVQENDLDTYFTMTVPGGDPYVRTWKNNDTNINIRPRGLAAPPVLDTQPSVKWFRETDRDGDGQPDVLNDFDGQGRGDVTLSWSPVPIADGYRVYLKDGANYRQVGTTLGNTSTAWSTRNAQAYPRDSAVAGWPAPYAGNPFAGAATPSAASRVRTFAVSGQPAGTSPAGTGIVLTDNGTNFYMRTWNTYAGPTRWGKYSRDGRWLSWVGPDLASKPILSAFLQDQVIYNGYADTPTRITGYSTVTGVATTLTFSKPLLKRDTGTELTAASNAIILAGDGNRIYSVAYGIGGSVYAGYTIREYDRNGVWIRDKQIATKSFYVDGAIAVETNKDSGALYLIEWGGKTRILKLDAQTLSPVNEWTSDQAATSVINGCFDPSTREFVLGTLDQGKFHAYSGPGLALRDNPNGLYKKTAPATHGESSGYEFVVVPYDDYAGEATFAENASGSVVFEKRTASIADTVRHATAQMGEFAAHEAEVVFDTGSMRMSVTDLAIASWGPAARLSRTYDSASPEDGYFGPGWRFNFEQAIETTEGAAVFRDEAGDAHRFYLVDGAFRSPSGFGGSLAREQVGAGLGFRLSFRTGDSLLFSGDGILVSESDANGNTVLYDRSTPGELSIWAANGQRIVVGFDPGRIASGAYSTADGVRQVTYSATAFPQYGTAHNTCTYDGGTPDSRSVRYDYGITLQPGRYYLTGLSVPEAPAAAWTFEAWPRPERWYTGGIQTGLVEWEAEDAATVVRLGAPWTETYEEFEWNPAGTFESVSNPRYADEATVRRTFAYTHGGEVSRETDPAGHSRTWTYDARGNLTSETGEEGRRTTYVYGTSGGALDRIVEETSPSGSKTYRTYDTRGNLLTEETVLNTAGERARTGRTYDTHGRVTREERAISATESAVATYGNFAPCGEPQTVLHLGVALSPGAAPVTVTEQAAYDAFGNVLARTDGTGTVTESNTYSPSGRLTRSEDASGTATVSVFDALGRMTETHRVAAGQVIDRAVSTYDGFGHLVREDHYAGESVAITVTHTVDARGRVTKSVHSVAGTTTRRYDAAGNVTAEWAPDVDPAKHGTDEHLILATRTVYDVLGRPTRVVAPGNTDDKAEVTAYSPAGDVVRTEAADGSWVAYAYDTAGNRVSETRPVEGAGTVTGTFAYDLSGRLTRSVKAAGTPEQAETTLAYDLLGRQTSAQLGQPSTKTYNTLSQVLAETDFDGIVTMRVFDRAGRATSESVGGKTATTVYDGLGRAVRATDPAGRTVRTTYDAFGRVTEEVHEVAGAELKRTGTAYDTLSRPVRVVQSPAGVTTAFSYATAASKVSVAVIEHAGLTSTITYDEHGRETARAVSGQGVALAGAVGARDAQGRRTEWRVAGLAASAEYDAAGKLTAQASPGITVTCTYDAGSGRKTAESVTLDGQGAVASSYSYTDAGRLQGALTGATQRAYAFDARGNLTEVVTGGAQTTFTADGNDRLTSSVTGGASTTYVNDALGRRTSQTTGGITTTFGWDGASRLVSWSRGGESAAYTYDGAGQRTRAVVTQEGLTTTATYTYDGITLLSLSAQQGTATWTVTYLYDEDARPYAGVYRAGTASPVTFLIATNDRGDVLGLTNTAGAPFARYTYDPYGRVLTTTSNGVTDITSSVASAIRDRQPLRYAGYAYDAHSATYYLSQRHYDPATMRFLTKDPARDDGEESAYQYCGGDPVGKVDPTGLAYVYTWRPRSMVISGANCKASGYISWDYNRNTKRLTVIGSLTYKVQRQYGVSVAEMVTARFVRHDGKSLVPGSYNPSSAYSSGSKNRGWRVIYDSYWVKSFTLSISIQRTGMSRRSGLIVSASRGPWTVNNPYGQSRPSRKRE